MKSVFKLNHFVIDWCAPFAGGNAFIIYKGPLEFFNSSSNQLVILLTTGARMILQGLRKEMFGSCCNCAGMNFTNTWTFDFEKGL